MLSRKDFEAKLMQLRDARPSQKPGLCAILCEMFAARGIACKPGMEYSYYEALVQESDIPDFRDIETRILDGMLSCFAEYPTPSEYMQRIVDRLSDPADGWEADSLRLRILKQLIRYGNCLVYQGETEKVHVYGGEGYLKKYAKARTGKTPKTAEEILQAVDEQVFDVLETANKAQKKQDGTYGLLKMADDLARGIFKAGGATKRDLYHFAIVFGMTYSSGSTADDASDIEKNLFEDYYTNNLMRFVTDSGAGEPGSVEMDPSGQGINYKNFAEMVYIYFISKNYPPAEKLRRASEMIERLKSGGHPAVKMEDTSTKFYTTLFTDEILQMSETAFEAFIAENYDCDVEFENVDKNGRLYIGRKGVLQVRTSQDTAFSIYSALQSQIRRELGDADDPLKACSYGLWFTDVAALEKAVRNSPQTLSSHRTPEELERFVRLLNGINHFLGCQMNEQECRTAERMTRTALIAAYYYCYNLHNENTAGKSLLDVYRDYTDTSVSYAEWAENGYGFPGLNSLLSEAGYQPISDKSIFDIAVIFSSYAYLTV